MMRIYKILLLMLCCNVFHIQAQDSSSVAYTKLTQGTLKNGMHYYIIHNEEPKGKVSFYFAQNVGSILENENQRGLAHFLEHMAFNGTNHYKGKTMLQFLEKKGVRFGSDINAFTMYDKTVYNINNVPSKNQNVLDSVLYILQDWSSGLTLADREIDDERGVVHEEWRTRYTSLKRAKDSVANQGLLKGSKYALRTPIGSMNVIDHFKYKELKDYYKKWYRTDLQAIIIVGDVDEKFMENRVKNIFSNIPSSKNEVERPVFEVPLGDSLTYLTIKDKEITTPSIELYCKHIKSKNQNIKDELKEEVLQQLISSILDKRLSHIAEQEQSPVYTARFNFDEIVRPLAVSQIKLQPKKDSILSAIKMALSEVQRFKTFGATPKEFNEVKNVAQRSLKTTNTKNYSNIYVAIALYKSFFKNRQLIDEHWKATFKLSYLNTLTNTDLMNYFTSYESKGGKVLAILGSDKIKYPSQHEVEKISQFVRNTKQLPFKDIVEVHKELMKLNLLGGSIIKKEKLKNNGKSYKLANGAKVIWYTNSKDSLDKNIYFKAFSFGGLSLLKQEDLANAFYTTMVAQASGIANLNQKELRVSGEVITPKITIHEYEETLEGFATAANFEKLCKGIYLSFEAPRFNVQSFNKTMQDLKRLKLLLKGNVQSALTDSLLLAKSGYSKREMHFGKYLTTELLLEKMKSIYKNRITNASDFTFIFKGNCNEVTFERIIQKYIGSISTTQHKEEFVNHKMRPAVGVQKVHITREMKTPQTTVRISISGDMPYTNKNEILLNLVEKLLAKRYLQRIREEEGGTYGVKVQSVLIPIPNNTFLIDIGFNCNPEKTKKLVSIVYEELDKLSQTVNQVELAEAKSGLISEMEVNIKSSTYSFNQLVKSLEYDIPLWSDEKVLHFIKNITSDQIKTLAKEINKKSRIVEGVLAPKQIK
ncbi:M16 family metallopeptidase [Zhouia sp. PK063]|uniref:M16 family metallopeptidase n=1 Tax=Zhouia sp. PK063 TaxID=3373602 RepID=UPI0037BD4CE8